MSLHEVTCSYCNGTGQAEVLEVYSQSACFWLRVPKKSQRELEEFCYLHETRWVDAKCPQCLGDKTYMVESVTCKIF